MVNTAKRPIPKRRPPVPKRRSKPWAAVDTETTGSDFRHGCRPFFVSTCDRAGQQFYWEWEVDPYTREVHIPQKDVNEITEFVNEHHLVFHNTKFDYRALSHIGVKMPDWKEIDDTLVASHVVSSGTPHGLKDLALYYLDISEEDQQSLHEITHKARTYGRKHGWAVASADRHPHFPAAKKTTKWAYLDTWMPRAVADAENYPADHPYRLACSKYGLLDTVRTIGLWDKLWELIQEMGLAEQYQKRRQLLEITYNMEEYGYTYHIPTLRAEMERYNVTAAEAETNCVRYADHKIDNLGSPKQLQGVLFGYFKLKPTKSTKEGWSTDKDVIAALRESTDPKSRAGLFLSSLHAYRKHSKAAEYLREYLLHGMPTVSKEFRSVHSSINITGTATTRQSSTDPNAQNIGKQERRDENGILIEDFNLRQNFSCLPNREWYSMDYENIEMRLFAYKSGDKELIKCFESGKAVHLVFAKILFPKLYANCERDKVSFKERYKSSYYQWVKNGDFSLIYGAGEPKADATYHFEGAYRRIRQELPLIDKFMAEKFNEARKEGCIYTLGGYRLDVPRHEPHKAVNYYIQGSAGWCMTLAMIRIFDYLKEVNRKAGLTWATGYRMSMTIHDELDFDFPKRQRKVNLPIITECARLMELSGKDIGVPTPVEVDYHPVSWAKGEKLALAS